MKKSIMGLILTLISIQLYACHIEPLRQCGDSAYFITKVFNPNSLYEFRITGTSEIILSFTTGDNVNDSIIALNVPVGTGIELQYKWIKNEWWTTTWMDPVYAASGIYAGCGALPVRISNFYAQKKDNNTTLSFQVEEEAGIDHYDIIASINGDKYKLIAQIKADGSKRYIIPISPVGSDFAISALLSLLILAKDKRKRFTWKKAITLLPLFLVMTFVACERINPQPYHQQYNYFKVQAVTHEGAVAASTEIEHN